MKIINIVGARPNFIKIAPIMRAMAHDSCFQPLLLHTGQHYDFNMSESFFKELEIPEPDINLGIGSLSHAKQVAAIMDKFEDICEEIKPNAILVVGDVNSTMACTLVASKKGIKTVHVEAGIRSFDRTMPEEINRLVTDMLADLLLPPSPDAIENLLHEGHSLDKIEMVGNVMIDSLLFHQQKIQQSNILNTLLLTKGNYATLTLHRPSNVDSAEAFKNIIRALKFIQNKITIVFPIHPRTKNMISNLGLNDEIAAMKNLKMIEPLGYFDFNKLVSDSQFVLTDSGGIQEETTVQQIPCITLRENTERPITITEGTNELAGSDTEKIIELTEMILSGNWKKGRIPEMWDGKTAERIINFLKTRLSFFD
ncbi:MAG: UDP-N-acetylglucosamine 2-epimerase (non-hydrolyzing) [Sphingobacteriia bacterium]|nr:UDP-N-acetylglucosamine 2-epimerase (non-hydrolyzing) [Sphingobacteriia bacterium]